MSTHRDDAFEAANGAPFFEWMGAHPDRGAAFDDAMAAGARVHALALAAALPWHGTVCDVGGGKGTLFDLPAVGGDAFEAVPPGFDGSARVVVVDAEASPRPLAGVSVAADVLMAALTPGGREPTTDDMRRLAAERASA